MAVVKPAPHLTTSSMSAVLFVRRKFSSVSFVKLKTKAVTPLNKRCQRPVVNSLDFK